MGLYDTKIDSAISVVNAAITQGILKLYVNQKTGNDANGGDSAHPIKSLEEAFRRGEKFKELNIYLTDSYLHSVARSSMLNNHYVSIYLQGHTLRFKQLYWSNTKGVGDMHLPAAYGNSVEFRSPATLTGVVNLTIYLQNGNVVYGPHIVYPDSSKSSWYPGRIQGIFEPTYMTGYRCSIRLHGSGMVRCYTNSDTVAAPGAIIMASSVGGYRYNTGTDQHHVASQDVTFAYGVMNGDTLETKYSGGPEAGVHYNDAFYTKGAHTHGTTAKLTSTKPVYI